MHVNIIHRKTGKSHHIDVQKIPLKNLKDIVFEAMLCTKYLIYFIANTREDMDFLNRNFDNLPTPSYQASKAVWSGDLATFILLNYPDA